MIVNDETIARERARDPQVDAYYRMLEDEARRTPSVAEMDRAYFEADHRRLEGPLA